MALTTDMNNQNVRKVVGKTIGLMNDVRDLVGDMIQCPRIIVAGSQSAGKSSLLESLTPVRLPKGNNTTTFHPFEIRMLYGEQKSQYKVWASSNPEKTLVTCDTDGLEKAMEEASDYICKDATTGQKHFSADRVVVEAASPLWLPLTLIDLPGLHSQRLVDAQVVDYSSSDVVKKMVEEEAKNESTIVLLVLSGTEEIANAPAYGLIMKDIDQQGKRTVGVFTKLDVEHASVALAIDAIAGKGLPLTHGYFGAVNLTVDEISELPDASQPAMQAAHEAKEKKVFGGPKFATDGVRKRCGIEALHSKLADLLHAQICKSLPPILRKMESLLPEKELHLKQLPNVPAMEDSEAGLWLLSQMDRKVDLAEKGLQKAGYYPSTEATMQRGNGILKSACAPSGIMRAVQHLLVQDMTAENVDVNDKDDDGEEENDDDADLEQSPHETKQRPVNVDVNTVQPLKDAEMRDLVLLIRSMKKNELPLCLPYGAVQSVISRCLGEEVTSACQEVISSLVGNMGSLWKDQLSKQFVNYSRFVASVLCRTVDDVCASVTRDACATVAKSMARAADSPATWNHYFEQTVRQHRMREYMSIAVKALSHTLGELVCQKSGDRIAKEFRSMSTTGLARDQVITVAEESMREALGVVFVPQFKSAAESVVQCQQGKPVPKEFCQASVPSALAEAVHPSLETIMNDVVTRSLTPMDNEELTARELWIVLVAYMKVAYKQLSDELYQQMMQMRQEFPTKILEALKQELLTTPPAVCCEDSLTKQKRAALQREIANLKAAIALVKAEQKHVIVEN